MRYSETKETFKWSSRRAQVSVKGRARTKQGKTSPSSRLKFAEGRQELPETRGGSSHVTQKILHTRPRAYILSPTEQSREYSIAAATSACPATWQPTTHVGMYLHFPSTCRLCPAVARGALWIRLLVYAARRAARRAAGNYSAPAMFATVCHPLCQSGLSTSRFVRRHPVDIPIDPRLPPLCFRAPLFPPPRCALGRNGNHFQHAAPNNIPPPPCVPLFLFSFFFPFQSLPFFFFFNIASTNTHRFFRNPLNVDRSDGTLRKQFGAACFLLWDQLDNSWRSNGIYEKNFWLFCSFSFFFFRKTVFALNELPRRTRIPPLEFFLSVETLIMGGGGGSRGLLDAATGVERRTMKG